MKRLMKEVTNKIYTVLANIGNAGFIAALNDWGDGHSAHWDTPELLPDFAQSSLRARSWPPLRRGRARQNEVCLALGPGRHFGGQGEQAGRLAVEWSACADRCDEWRDCSEVAGAECPRSLCFLFWDRRKVEFEEKMKALSFLPLQRNPFSLARMANKSTPSVSQLQRALKISEQIQVLETELHTILGGSSEPQAKRKYTKKAAGSKKRTMSPEAREKIAAAQRKRWAKQKRA